MRYLLGFVLCLLMFSGAQAKIYGNARFHYFIYIPAVFTVQEDAPVNGDGAAFQSEDGEARLAVFGQFLTEGSFLEQVKTSIGYELQEGWKMAYVSSPKKTGVSFSGSKGNRIAYARVIPICEGTAFVEYRIEYPRAQRMLYDNMLVRLNKSLRQGKGAC